MTTMLALGGCDSGHSTASAASTTTTTVKHSSTSVAPSRTTAPRVSTPAPNIDATFKKIGDPAEVLIGTTIAQARSRGYQVHQQSPFGKTGEWALFTVNKDGNWLAFTAKNVTEVDGYHVLDNKSKIVGGETLPKLPDGEWYGVEGVLRGGKPTGGLMMHGVGYKREADGTYPVKDAYHVNLATLKVERTSTKNLDIEESCG